MAKKNEDKNKNAPVVNAGAVDPVELDDSNGRKGSGGVKGMHKGHSFSETCNCARCSKSRLKKVRDLSMEASIISKFVSELPHDKILYTFDDETLDLMGAKLNQLKAKFPNMKYKEFMESVLKLSLINFLNSL